MISIDEFKNITKKAVKETYFMWFYFAFHRVLRLYDMFDFIDEIRKKNTKIICYFHISEIVEPSVQKVSDIICVVEVS